MAERKVEIVPLNRVHPDADQPRKMFAVERMNDLMGSIKEHGIMSPLIVEKSPEGYLLVDGERRFRAATELGLKEVPVILVSNQSATDRLIRQFHLQEQHEGWTATEKANAVGKLAQAMKLTVREMGKLLSLPDRTIGQYIAFYELLDRKQFEKSEVSIQYAGKIVGVRKFITGVFNKKDLEFDVDHQRALESAIIARIKSGDIRKATDINKIQDAARVDPTAILKFIKNDKMSTQKLFIDADAKVAHHYRNAMYSARSITMHIEQGIGLKLGSYITSADISVLKRASEAIKTILGSRA